jgi:hypothetical protein
VQLNEINITAEQLPLSFVFVPRPAAALPAQSSFDDKIGFHKIIFK